MRQQGVTGRRNFRIVLADERSPRDGKYIERLGWYDPAGKDDKEFRLDMGRVAHWVGVGASISEAVTALVRRSAPDFLKELRQKKVVAVAKRRAKRKDRVKQTPPLPKS
jgi:small subunit ribosomal protein S16